jgi:hypothetical protein
MNSALLTNEFLPELYILVFRGTHETNYMQYVIMAEPYVNFNCDFFFQIPFYAMQILKD